MRDLITALSENAGVLALIGVVLLAVSLTLLILLLKRQKASAQAAAQEREKQDDAAEERFSSLERQLSDSFAPLPGRDEQNARLDSQTTHLINLQNGQTQAITQRIDTLSGRFDTFELSQQQRLNRVTNVLDEKLTANDQRIEKMRDTLSQSVTKLQEENSKKLEEMRVTVDEKLHATLDKRLSESFSLVNERLEQVYKGLGEMQSLASGVGDLKKVLTNVKSRGVWGEMQLGTLLSQVLARTQYDENVAVVPGSSQRVEYAVKLPGQGEGTVYLPIDAKFPIEDYERLQSALDTGDADTIAAATLALQNALKTEAKRIAGKYISPPHTTDFAVMFLPLEGLYAEALRARGLAEELQEKLRIVIAGPTTLTALLTSLQVGFRTLAIEKRSDEVWQLLSAVKTEFGHFSELLELTQRRLSAVSKSIEQASSKSRTIERKLKKVEVLDEVKAVSLLDMAPDDADNDSDPTLFDSKDDV